MTNFSDVKILLFGTGAVGSYYCGKLAQTGASVSVVSRSDYDVIKNKGIYIKSINGDFLFKPHKILKHAYEYNDIADYIIVATKVLPEIDIFNLIKDCVHQNSAIVLLQNGIYIEHDIIKAFPDNEIISALAFICASRPEYGFINHQDFGRITLGRFPGGVSEKADLLAKMLNSVKVEASSTIDVIQARWQKLLWNAPFNPLSVICGGANTKEILNNPYIRNLAVNIMKEVQTLSIADKHPLTDDQIIDNINFTEKMTPYKTSMLLDFENKRPMEIEPIIGNALKIAKQYNISIPYMQTIYAILNILNQKNLNLF